MRKSYRKFNQKSLKTQLTKFYETFSHALIICNTNMSFLDWLASNLLSDFFYNWLPFLPIHHILKSSHLLVPFFSDWPYVRDPLRSFLFFLFFFFYTYNLHFSNKKFTVTRQLYIWTYLGYQSKSHYKIVDRAIECMKLNWMYKVSPLYWGNRP